MTRSERRSAGERANGIRPPEEGTEAEFLLVLASAARVGVTCPAYAREMLEDIRDMIDLRFRRGRVAGPGGR